MRELLGSNIVRVCLLAVFFIFYPILYCFGGFVIAISSCCRSRRTRTFHIHRNVSDGFVVQRVLDTFREVTPNAFAKFLCIIDNFCECVFVGIYNALRSLEDFVYIERQYSFKNSSHCFTHPANSLKGIYYKKCTQFGCFPSILKR